MTNYDAMQKLANISRRYATILTVSEIEALYLGVSALKTIEDGNYILPTELNSKLHLNQAYGKMVTDFAYADTDSIKENANND